MAGKAGDAKAGGVRASRPKKKPDGVSAAPAKAQAHRRVVKDPAIRGTVSLEVARAVADALRRKRGED